MCGVQPVRRRLGDAGEEPADRVLRAEREEPVQQAALVHHLDAARVQAERADDLGRLGVPLQHDARRTPCSRSSLASIMPVGPPPATITSIMHSPVSRWGVAPAGTLLHDPGLAQAPRHRSSLDKWIPGSGRSPGSRRPGTSKSGGGSCANIPATRWTAGRCRPIDFLQERQLTTR